VTSMDRGSLPGLRLLVPCCVGQRGLTGCAQKRLLHRTAHARTRGTTPHACAHHTAHADTGRDAETQPHNAKPPEAPSHTRARTTPRTQTKAETRRHSHATKHQQHRTTRVHAPHRTRRRRQTHTDTETQRHIAIRRHDGGGGFDGNTDTRARLTDAHTRKIADGTRSNTCQAHSAF